MSVFQVQRTRMTAAGEGLSPLVTRVAVTGVAVFLAVTVVPGIESAEPHRRVGGGPCVDLPECRVATRSLPAFPAADHGVVGTVYGRDQCAAPSGHRLSCERVYGGRTLAVGGGCHLISLVTDYPECGRRLRARSPRASDIATASPRVPPKSSIRRLNLFVAACHFSQNHRL